MPIDDASLIMCNNDDETTEHIFKCTKYKELSKNHLVWSDEGKHWQDIEWLREAARVVERIEEIREREMNRQTISIQ